MSELLCTLYSLLFTLYSLPFTLHSLLFTFYSLLFTLPPPNKNAPHPLSRDERRCASRGATLVEPVSPFWKRKIASGDAILR